MDSLVRTNTSPIHSHPKTYSDDGVDNFNQFSRNFKVQIHQDFKRMRTETHFIRILLFNPPDRHPRTLRNSKAMNPS